MGERLLFFSHSGADAAEAQELVRRMRDAPAARATGLGVWFDADDLEAGRPWKTQIEAAIRRSSAFAVYVGSGGVANWVDAEVQLALDRAFREPDYKFIPVLSPMAPSPQALPGFVGQFQGVRAAPESAEWFERLMAAVLGEVEHPLEQNPFFGLRAIDESRSHLFFGRKRETDDLIDKLGQAPLVMVVGDSGSGKSSLVRAGLVPKFRGGALAELRGKRPGEEIWHVVVMQPRSEPLRQLAEAIYEVSRSLGVPAKDRDAFAEWARSGDPIRVERALRCDLPRERVHLLLVVDQFEELWTSTPTLAREQFVDLLLALTAADEGRVRVVLTMRQDYVNLCSEIEALHSHLKAHDRRARFDLRRMDDQSLQLVVSEPLRLAGIAENARNSLARLVTSGVGERAGDLALVQMALTEAWNVRGDCKGDLQAAYTMVGGVEGALAKAAEKIRSEQSEEDRSHIDAILIRLVQLGDTGGATRRVATRDEFDDARWSWVQFLAEERGKRLVLLGSIEQAPTVEIAHEALVTAWPHLQSTLQRDAAHKRVFDALISKAKAWHPASPEEKSQRLASGAELAAFERLKAARPSWLSAVESEFVIVSRGAVERRTRRERLKARAIAALAAVGFGLALAASLFAIDAREAKRVAERTAAEADLAARRATEAEISADRNAAEVLAETARHWVGGPRRAVLRLGEAYQREPTDLRIRFWLPRALQQIDALQLTLEGHRGSLRSASFSDDGTRILTAGSDGTVSLWHRRTGERLAIFDAHRNGVDDASFSREGERILTTGADRKARLWDGSSGAPLATLTGHDGPVYFAAFSRRGDRIVTTGSDNTARLWDAKTGQLLHTLIGHVEPVYRAAFGADDRRVVTAGRDGRVKVWNAQTGKLIYSREGHQSPVRALSFSGDGKRIVTTTASWETFLWDAETGKRITSLDGHSGVVYSVAISGDGTRILTAANDPTVKLWDAATGKLRASLTGHIGRVYSAAFSPDGLRVVTTGSDRTTRLWEGTTGSLLATLEGHSGIVRSAAFSADGKSIVTASEDATAKVWDATIGNLLARLEDDVPRLPAVSFNADGTRAVVASYAQEAKLFDGRSGKLLASLRGHTDMVHSAVFSADGRRVLTGSDDKTAKLWDGQTGKLVRSLAGHTGPVRSVAFSAGGERIVTGSDDETAKLWDGQTDTPLFTLVGHGGPLRSVSISGDGKRVVTASVDSTAKLWNAETGTVVETLDTGAQGAGYAEFTRDGKRIVTTSESRAVKLWDGNTGGLIRVLETEASPRSAALSADGARVATANDERSVILWDGQTGERQATLEGHAERVLAVTFSADGKAIVTASEDATAKVWETASGKLLVSLEGHAGPVGAASFSSDGQRIVTASEDRTVKLWDASNGKLLGSLEAHSAGVYAAVISPHGERLITASDDRTANIWDVHLERRTPKEVAAFVAQRVPWKLQGGAIVRR